MVNCSVRVLRLRLVVLHLILRVQVFQQKPMTLHGFLQIFLVIQVTITSRGDGQLAKKLTARIVQGLVGRQWL